MARRRGRKARYGLLVAAVAVAVFLGFELARGRWELGLSEADRYAVWGVDVSHHQARVDWARVAKHPRIRFAYVKASEGGDWIDDAFAANWEGARRAGLRVGAYHFFSFCRPPLEQAKNFLAVLPRDRDSLPPAVDVEFGGNCNGASDVAAVRRDLQAFVAEIAQRTGREPILYVTGEAYERIVRGGGFTNPVWIRSIFVMPDLEESAWHFWQFADDARVEGIDSSVDLNVFQGDLRALGRL